MCQNHPNGSKWPHKHYSMLCIFLLIWNYLFCFETSSFSETIYIPKHLKLLNFAIVLINQYCHDIWHQPCTYHFHIIQFFGFRHILTFFDRLNCIVISLQVQPYLCTSILVWNTSGIFLFFISPIFPPLSRTTSHRPSVTTPSSSHPIYTKKELGRKTCW